MPNLKDIRRRISTVKSTQQITKAMKMISAVKLRKAQDQILEARPYAHELISVISNLAHHGGRKKSSLLSQRPKEKVHLYVVTSDRGLCGSYNGAIIRRTERFIREEAEIFKEFKVSFIGRKGEEYFKARLNSSWRGTYHEGVMTHPSFLDARNIANDIMQKFKKGHLDHIFFIYNEFKSAIAQKVVVETLLPVTPSKDLKPEGVDYLYEPSRKDVLKSLLPKYVRIQIYRILLEAVASEHGARMTAMDNATTNAGEMLSKLTLLANRVRQAAITTELMEIVGGAEALKG